MNEGNDNDAEVSNMGVEPFLFSRMDRSSSSENHIFQVHPINSFSC